MRKLKVPGSALSEIEIFEFNGGSGPNVVITGAIHGNEQTGVHAARLLMKELEKHEITGNIKIIPVANPTAYYHRQRVSPFDELDMSRIFPGSDKGTLTYRTAAALWEETNDAEYVVDLHCCGIVGSTYTLADYESSQEIKELCTALGMPVACQTSGSEGQFFLESLRRRGQKSILIELPGGQPGGVIDLEWAEFCSSHLLNYLKYIKAVKGKYIEPIPRTVFCGKMERIDIPAEGLFTPAVESGEFLSEGAVMGYLDHEGGREVFTAPADVRTISISLPKYAFVGESVIGFIRKAEVK